LTTPNLWALEVVNVRLSDIDSQRMVIRVMQSKRKKDRKMILSLLLEMRRHFLGGLLGGRNTFLPAMTRAAS
jgi:hypothetical protein